MDVTRPIPPTLLIAHARAATIYLTARAADSDDRCSLRSGYVIELAGLLDELADHVMETILEKGDRR